MSEGLSEFQLPEPVVENAVAAAGFQPDDGWLLVKPDEVPEQTASGLWIPEGMQQTVNSGTVWCNHASIISWCNHVHMWGWLHPDNDQSAAISLDRCKILFYKFGFKDFWWERQRYLLVPKNTVLALSLAVEYGIPFSGGMFWAPAPGRVIAKIIPEDTVKRNGLWLPNSMDQNKRRRRPWRGEVLRFGWERDDETTGKKVLQHILEPGDTILGTDWYNFTNAMMLIRDDGDEVIVHRDDILAVIEREDQASD